MAEREKDAARSIMAVFAAMALVVSAFIAVATPASANHEDFGVCHRTEGANPFVYISPDQSSSHLDSEENPEQGHEGDRAATEAEFEAGECFADEEPNGEEPNGEEPNGEEPVGELPGTGTGQDTLAGSTSAALLIGLATVLAAAGFVARRSTTRI